MQTQNLNIVGALSLSQTNLALNEYEKTADYAEIGPTDQVQMFFKLKSLDDHTHKDKMIWHYLSYCNIWQPSSCTDMSKKRLLKVVE